MLLTGVAWALAVILAPSVASRYNLSQSPHLAGISTAGAIILWSFFGGDPAKSAHAFMRGTLLKNTWFATHLALAIAVLSWETSVLIRTNPSTLIYRALLEQVKEIKDDEFFDICLHTLPPLEKTVGFNGGFLNAYTSACNINWRGLLEGPRPKFLFGEPGSGKKFVFKWLQQHLKQSKTASVLIDLNDCPPFTPENATRHISECIRHHLRGLVPVGTLNPDGAVDDFLARDDWWLFVDAMDDRGDASLVIPLLKEMPQLARQRASKFLANGRGENLAYITHQSNTDDTVQSFVGLDRVFLSGLSLQGTRDALWHFEKGGVFSFNFVRSMKNCPDPNKALAEEFLSRYPFINRWQAKPLSLDTLAPCSNETQVAISDWMFRMQFNDYCQHSLCDDAEDRLGLEEALLHVRLALKHRSSSTLRATELTALLPVPREGQSRPGKHKVIRALLETGILTVVGTDEFEIRQHRL
ncbi:hypothetical protein OWM54_00285 [Myxococcus sp. MISCRS1]|uniref:hypothetical protein n=1 Tax=Myxococcus sp. MISCRS1 TaxID=2996786 RepID=UPI002271BEE9|nr:hypothetical protein [Myxococcus sp. MISCRS1]MCY0995563.1 hypothetical protein [Myxococcus sp. MISCRS1]